MKDKHEENCRVNFEKWLDEFICVWDNHLLRFGDVIISRVFVSGSDRAGNIGSEEHYLFNNKYITKTIRDENVVSLHTTDVRVICDSIKNQIISISRHRVGDSSSVTIDVGIDHDEEIYWLNISFFLDREIEAVQEGEK